MVYRESGSSVHVAVSARLFRSSASWDEDALIVAELGGRGALTPPVDEDGLATGSGLVLGVFDGTAQSVSTWAARRLLQLVSAPLSPVTAASVRARLVAATEETARGAYWALQGGTLRGMGTTATVAAVVGATLVLVHVGDSRGYVWRRGRLVQVSRDDTLVRQVFEGGFSGVDPRDLELDSVRNVVTQVIGPKERVTLFVETIELRRGDVLVLCTSGIHRWLEPAAMESLIALRPGATSPCDGLREAALLASSGNSDIGLVVASFDDGVLLPPAVADVLPDWSDDALLAAQR